MSTKLEILRVLQHIPKSTREIGNHFNIPANQMQRLYTRLTTLRRSGWIDLKNVRPTPLAGLNQSLEEERERNASGKGGKPKGNPEHWKWVLTFQGEEELKKFLK